MLTAIGVPCLMNFENFENTNQYDADRYSTRYHYEEILIVFNNKINIVNNYELFIN